MRRFLAVIAVAGIVLLPPLVQRVRGASVAAVEVEAARRQPLSPSVLATGVLGYTSQVALMPEVLGRVQRVDVVEGQRVHAGDVVVALAAHDAQAQVAQGVAAQNQARIEVQRQVRELAYRSTQAQRYRELRAQGIVSEAQFEQYAHEADAAGLQARDAQEALQRIAAQLAQAREALAKTQIRSPIDGEVTAIETRVGQTVVPSVSNVPGSVLLTVSNPSQMLAEVDVGEADLIGVHPGQPARVYTAAEPDKALAARVERVSVAPEQVQHGRVYKTRLRLDDSAAPSFHPGMGCRAEIFVGRPQPVIAVPQQAVLDADDAARAARPHVFVLAGGIARRREVVLGQSDDANVEIAGGLAASEPVVVGPARVLAGLRDGDRVDVAPAPRSDGR